MFLSWIGFVNYFYMEIVLNKIEEKLSAVDSQLENYRTFPTQPWCVATLMNISKKVNVRVSLLVSISVLLCSIFCFVVFGPSMLAWVFVSLFDNTVGTLSVAHIQFTVPCRSCGTIPTKSMSNCTLCYDACHRLVWCTGRFLACCTLLISPFLIFPSCVNEVVFLCSLPFFYPFKISLLLLCVSKDVNVALFLSVNRSCRVWFTITSSQIC